MRNWTAPRRLGFGLALAAVVCAACAAAASASIPVVKGPEIKAGAVTPNVDTVCIFEAALGLACWTPAQLGAAYDFPAGLDGSGQTIMIVDAYGNPNMAANLHSFDVRFGIPDPAAGKFVVENGPSVTASGSGDLDGWGIETSLDVEYAHAMAPGARIVLVQAASDDDANIVAAEAEFIPKYPGAIISQSFGEPEGSEGLPLDAYRAAYEQATRLGDTILASAGDFGATWTQLLHTTTPSFASYPSSDPLVTGVGGTEGNPYPDGLLNAAGAYGGEQVWNEGIQGVADAATGGAPSVVFAAPPWQRSSSPYKTRSVPDVAYNASILGGVDVIYTDQTGATAGHTFQNLVGGTSAGSPQWASIFAIVDQARGLQGKKPIGFANESLYKIGTQNKSAGAFHDITEGTNALDSPLGFAAGPGYDLSTGLGTPDVANLVPLLVAAPAASNPDAGTAANTPSSTPSGRLRAHTMSPG